MEMFCVYGTDTQPIRLPAAVPRTSMPFKKKSYNEINEKKND